MRRGHARRAGGGVGDEDRGIRGRACRAGRRARVELAAAQGPAVAKAATTSPARRQGAGWGTAAGRGRLANDVGRNAVAFPLPVSACWRAATQRHGVLGTENPADPCRKAAYMATPWPSSEISVFFDVCVCFRARAQILRDTRGSEFGSSSLGSKCLTTEPQFSV